jgi:hypothetical protein
VASKKENHPPDTTPSSAERSRSSGPAPRSHEVTARRGRIRDALASLGNLETMLRAPSPSALAAEELEELRRGLSWVRESFSAAALESDIDQRDARRELETFANDRVTEIEDELAKGPSADSIARKARDLESAAALLELSERSTEGAQVDVSVATLAEQALHLAWTIRSYGVQGIHVRPCEGDCSVSCDPHVVARVLAIAVVTVRASSSWEGAIVVRTHVEEDAGVIEVTRYTSEDLAAHVVQTRVAAHVAPTDAVVAAAARAANIGLVIEPGRVLIRCPRVM